MSQVDDRKEVEEYHQQENPNEGPLSDFSPASLRLDVLGNCVELEPLHWCPVSSSRGVNVLRLIECSHPTRNLHDEIHQKHCRAALCIALLTCCLLVPSNGKVSASLATVASQMLEDKNVVPLVFAWIGPDLCRSSRRGCVLGGNSSLCSEGVEVESNVNAIPTPKLVKICFGVMITDISLNVVDHAYGEDLYDTLNLQI
ncbi:hypothetical protein RHSIM_Rhsim13G0045800 [Rhododendron simsii]|uniref:Uncharacterized protein n=1 Tax=Rhododendron simsii TaxID=118357 RepID=A0A834G7K3_RHOSS|nr:hypothetical protein RHSIM_Rhsim13G0045800 [Rhododendron simsii]